MIRFSSLGDIVWSLAAVDLGRMRWPDASFHFLTLDRFAPLVEGFPAIQKVIALKSEAGRRSLVRLARLLREEHYSIIVDLHNSLRSRIIRWHMNASRVLVVKKPRLRRFLHFRLHLDQLGKEHELSRLIQRTVFGGERMPADTPAARIWLGAEERAAASRRLADVGVGGDFVALVPGAAWRIKQWPVENYRHLTNSLAADNRAVVLLGDRKDHICDAIAEGLPSIVNLRGKTTLRLALGILAHARLAIGGDTGLIHAAEALGTPVVLLTGPTSPETGAVTRNPDSITLGTDVWCRPCSKNGGVPCYRSEQYCMTLLHPDSVVSAAGKVLARVSAV